MPEFNPASRRDRHYTIAICKGAGLVDETRQIITHWRPGEEVKAFVQRVQAEDLLGRYTAYRARDIARRVFARRFLIPSDRPARMLKCIVDRGLPRKTFTEMLFLFACRADDLLYDFTIQSYWEAGQRGRTRLTAADALAFFADALSRGYIPRPWSDRVEIRIARGLLGILRDVGLLLGNRRNQQGHEIVPYDMSDEGVACLTRELHDSGVSDSALSQHMDWRLFGLSCEHVHERLDKLGEERGLLIQRAGSVVSITWRVKSMEELIDVLAR
jgi:Putative inner membrane protein (DUF1819)